MADDNSGFEPFHPPMSVKESIKVYEKKHRVQLRMGSSKTLEVMKKRRVAVANLLLEYYVFELFCKFSGNAKKITLKDLSNIQQSVKEIKNKNQIKKMNWSSEYLEGKPGSCVEILIREDNNFGGVFYQDDYITKMFVDFPELIMVDATFILLDLRFPVYFLLGIDGNGLNAIIVFFSVLSEEIKVLIFFYLYV